MTREEKINEMIEKIEALEPRTKEIVLRFLDFLLQVQETD